MNKEDILNQALPKLKEHFANYKATVFTDEKIREDLAMFHSELPRSVRFVIKQERFVEFFMTKKDQLFS